jgi:hypothetical protein
VIVLSFLPVPQGAHSWDSGDQVVGGYGEGPVLRGHIFARKQQALFLLWFQGTNWVKVTAD